MCVRECKFCGLNLVLVQNFLNWFNIYFLLSYIIHYIQQSGAVANKIETSSKNINPFTAKRFPIDK